MSVYSEQAKKLRVQLAEETTKLENALKQEQLAHEQSKKDLASLEERDKENEEFLIKDAKKSKRLNEELVQTKEKLKYQEAELQKTVELLKSNPVVNQRVYARECRFKACRKTI